MTASLRSGLTLLALSLLLVVAAVWGWRAATQPFPDRGSAPLCTETTVRTGDQVFRDQVAVSVYNGSDRSGLASATLEQLEERGFVGADSGNAPTPVAGVAEIWSDEPRNAAVRLVARQFKGAKVVSGKKLGRGVVVVVGESFKGLKKDVESVTAVETSTFCSPPESE